MILLFVWGIVIAALCVLLTQDVTDWLAWVALVLDCTAFVVQLRMLWRICPK